MTAQISTNHSALLLASVPRLTTANAHRDFYNYKRALRTQASRDLNHSDFYTPSGVRITNLLETGLLDTHQEFNQRSIAQHNLVIGPGPAGAINWGIHVPANNINNRRHFPENPLLPLGDDIGNGVMTRFKINNELYKDFKNFENNYLAVITATVDEHILQQLKINDTMENVSLVHIMTVLQDLYNKFTETDYKHVMDQTKFLFNNQQSFSSQVATMKLHYDMISVRLPLATVTEPNKIDQLLANIQGYSPALQQEIDHIIKQYKFIHPDIANRNFTDLTAYIILHFHPDISPDAETTTGNNGFAHYSKQQPSHLSTTKQHQHYCFVHGFNSTHPGSNCKVLQALGNCRFAQMATQPTTVGTITSTNHKLSTTQLDTLTNDSIARKTKKASSNNANKSSTTTGSAHSATADSSST